MNLLLILVILGTVIMSAVAQVTLKAAVSSPAIAAGSAEGFLPTALAVAGSPFVWIGLSIYGASIFAWMWVLSKVDVSVAYPFVGISFILTAVMGALVLHENITPLRIAGTLLVALGCFLIVRSA